MADDKKDIFDKIMSFRVFQKFRGVYEKYKSVLLYIFFGGLTTIVSIASFYLFNSYIRLNELIANILSWICAVSFAYITNRVWVFSSKVSGKEVVKEILSFFSGRLLTLGLEEGLLFIFVTLLQFDGMTIKILAQFVVLVLNYIISKIFVFGRKKRGESVCNTRNT